MPVMSGYRIWGMCRVTVRGRSVQTFALRAEASRGGSINTTVDDLNPALPIVRNIP